MVDGALRHRDPDLEGLAEVAQVGGAHELVVGVREALLGERRPRLVGERVVDRGNCGRLERLGERDVGADVVVLDVDGEQAEGRDVARVRRHQHGAETEHVHQAAQQQRARATEGGQGEVAYVEAALDGDLAQRVGLVPRRDLQHAGRARLGREPELRRRAPRCRRRGCVDVEGDLAAQQVRRDPAEEDVCVGDGDLGATLRVAERPGVGAGRVRSDLERALG